MGVCCQHVLTITNTSINYRQQMKNLNKDHTGHSEVDQEPPPGQERAESNTEDAQDTKYDFVHSILLYGIPLGILFFVNITECWPYKPLVALYRNTGGGGKYGSIPDDIIYTGAFLIFGFSYWLVVSVIKKILGK
jgi:hypothetical protein